MLDFEDEQIVNHTPQVKKTEELPNPLLETRSEPEEENKDAKTGDVDNQPVETIKKEYKKLPVQKPIEPEKPKPLPDFKKKPDYLPTPKKERKLFWKIYAITITIIIILAIVGLVFLIKGGYLTPKFNSTSEIINNNNYDFKPSISSPVSNDYENNFNNTVEINFDLSDEFIEKVCGNYS